MFEFDNLPNLAIMLTYKPLTAAASPYPRVLWVQEAGGSNPLAPTTLNAANRDYFDSPISTSDRR